MSAFSWMHGSRNVTSILIEVHNTFWPDVAKTSFFRDLKKLITNTDINRNSYSNLFTSTLNKFCQLPGKGAEPTTRLQILPRFVLVEAFRLSQMYLSHTGARRDTFQSCIAR